MDALSHLVRLFRLEASLDLRCQFADGVALEHAAAPAREIEFHLALAGRCTIEVEGRPPLAVEAGDFVALPRGTAHRVRTAGPSDPGHRLVTTHDDALPLRRSEAGEVTLDLLCGRFAYDSSAVDAFFATLPSLLHVSLAGAAPVANLERLVALIRAEVDSELPGAFAVVSSLATVLFTLAMRVSSERDAVSPGLLRLIGDARLARATRAILDEPGRDWTLEQLAERAAMSRATFARRFAEAAGMAPGALLLDVRMLRAAGALAHTRRGVADIGQDVGYQSEAAFGKAFKRAMGVSPAAYRRAGAPGPAGAAAEAD
jgi:AraC family transcriptional regulator, activator of mtrCDE